MKVIGVILDSRGSIYHMLLRIRAFYYLPMSAAHSGKFQPSVKKRRTGESESNSFMTTGEDHNYTYDPN